MIGDEIARELSVFGIETNLKVVKPELFSEMLLNRDYHMRH